MRLTALARRYAGALLEAAKDAQAIDKVESDLGLISHSLQTMPRLREALSHPLIPASRKKQIAAEVFQGKIEDITLDFLYLLLDKRREHIADDVEQEYVRLADEFRGILPVIVCSAVLLTEDERIALTRKIEGSTGKKVVLQSLEDTELIGGITVRIGDTVIDGSVRGQLASLKDQLLGRK